jgi:two-component system cell cycle response regulator
MRPAFDPTATLTDIGETQTREVRSLRNASPILLVDDDEEVRDHLTAVLQVAGYEVHTANSGNEALRTLHENFVPILIADRNMPDMDGLSLCRKVRTEDYPNYLYVLLLTAHDSQQDILSGLEAGADDYLSKRISPAELVARVRTAQRIVSLEQALRASLAHKRQQADTDALTGAYSRHYLNRQLTRELKRAQRYGNSLSVLLLDVDHFKQVNDRYGHPAGDEVLAEFGERIRAGLPRDSDWVARYGGEEFLVVLPQTDQRGAHVVAEKLRRSVEQAPMRTTSAVIPVTVSVGVAGLEAVAHASRDSIDLLLDTADRCLYRSKESGRNRVTVAAPVGR